MQPDFLVIGAMKAGTTSLYQYLGSHPEVSVSRPKEIDFFSHEANWSRGAAWYERHFERSGDAWVAGDFSPSYSMHPRYRDVPQRIASIAPDVRLIYMIREPIARMQSHYAHQRLRGREHRPIERALLEEWFYLEVSSYALQLEQYLPYIPADRILVVDSNDLRSARRETLRKVFRFIGVSSEWEAEEMSEERNLTASGHPRAALKRLHQLPGYSAVRIAAHAVLGKRMVTRVAYRRIDATDLAIRPSVEDELRQRLAPDQERLRELLTRLGPSAVA